MRYLAGAAIFVALASLAGLGGCRQKTSSIAVIPRTTASLLWEPLHLGVAETARGTGIHVDWNAPPDEGDSEKQLNLFAASVSAADRGIIFAPDETLASRSSVLRAVARHIPVVIVDDELGPPAGPYLSYVSNDEIAGARLAAERIAAVLHGHGTIAIMGISPRNEGGLSRDEEFERAMAAAAPGIQIKARHFGNTVVTHQQQIAQELLNAPDHVDAIVALTATATRGAYYARIATEPHPAITIVGFDQDLLAPIQLGEVDAVVVQNTRTIGQLAMRNLATQIAGGHVPDRIVIAPLLLTRQNLDSPAIQSLWAFATYRWSDQ
jgi:ribose transport system substrate-binding protein